MCGRPITQDRPDRRGDDNDAQHNGVSEPLVDHQADVHQAVPHDRIGHDDRIEHNGEIAVGIEVDRKDRQVIQGAEQIADRCGQ